MTVGRGDARNLPDLEESWHGGTSWIFNKSGPSNYAFGDGSVWAMRYGQVLCPLKFWATTEEGRLNYGACRPH